MTDHLRRLTRVVVRARRGLYERTASPGVEPVDIRALISPLRYDVVIRAQFFDFLSQHRGLAGREIIEGARRTAYAAWFEHVECARYYPDLLQDRKLLNERFTARVAGADCLLRSFESEGFDPTHPVTLIAAPVGSTSDSGAPALGDIHIGDGCHRLALLLRQGARLEPTMYRVRRNLAPLVDNTAVLLRHDVVTESEYVRHLAARFPVGNVKTVRDVVARVETVAPSMLETLGTVIASQWESSRS